jgi:hypothetical protein
LDRTPGGFAENFEALWANCLAENDAISAACDSKAVPPPQRNTNEWSTEGDKVALLGFKDSGNGAGLESWTPDGEPCAGGWRGVACEGGAVTAVELGTYLAWPTANPNFNGDLTGDLAELASLFRIVTLNLGDMAVAGELSSLSGLAELSTLAMSRTVVTGNLSSLSGLPALSTLFLDGTAVTGWPLVSAGGKTFADASDHLGSQTK